MSDPSHLSPAPADAPPPPPPSHSDPGPGIHREWIGDHPVLAALGRRRRWTISWHLDHDKESGGKVPLDMVALMSQRRVRGAFATDATCLVDLPTIRAFAPDAPNHAFWLDAAVDGVCVVDVEPDCPPVMAHLIAGLPDALYREVSMSGRGFHLVVPLPATLAGFPHLVGRSVLREPHGWYELLFRHWVTFTGRVVDAATTTRIDQVRIRAHGPQGVDDLVAHLAGVLGEPGRTRAVTGADLAHDHDLDAVLSPLGEDLVARVVDQLADAAAGSPAGGDWSRHEWAIACQATALLVPQCRALTAAGRDELEEPVVLVHHVMHRVLPARGKHRQSRRGVPFLFYRAAQAVAAAEPGGSNPDPLENT